MDALVQRFPNDYRTYLFRGLYYGFFVLWNEDSLKPTMDNFRKAGEINASTPLTHFLLPTCSKKPSLSNREGGNWGIAVPDTLGEMLLAGVSRGGG